ncbi:MAG: hypothetical protein SV487_00130 [Thermodesulfobacteriota bacterium]|nr:hypothetical protein [Thermodesulfobacteriota bacterium]
MPKKKIVDATKLINAVNSGQTDKELMKKFGFKTRMQLKSLYLDALVEKGTVASIAGRSNRRDDASENKDIQVNKRGSLIVPRTIMEKFGFKAGELFAARKTRSGVSLRKL